jgi:hypothetical protein
MNNSYKISRRLFFDEFKIILSYKANRALPVIRQILKCGAGRNATVGVTYFRVINIPAWNTPVLFNASTSSDSLYLPSATGS